MRRTKFLSSSTVFCFLAVSIAIGIQSGVRAESGNIVGWGYDGLGESTPPAGDDFIAISAGNAFGLALKSDGSIVGWGRDDYGQATPPAGVGYVAIAAGSAHSLALDSDGSIVGWGRDLEGQATPPAGVGFVAIAAGDAHSLALKSDGSIVGWGYDTSAQATPPDGVGFVAIAAGGAHGLALTSDRSIVGWGDDTSGQATPPAGDGFAAIAARGGHSLALTSEGSIVAWGYTGWNLAPPAGHDFVAIAAGQFHDLALTSGGTIAAWGGDTHGQASPPTGNGFVAIAAGDNFSLALMDRTLVTPTGEFTSLTPARILDTRNGTGRGGLTVPVGAGQSIDVQITGTGGVPTTGVSAVVMNVTVTQPTAPSFLTVWPTGLPLPEISNLNYLPGQSVPNLVTVAVGTGGKVSAFNAFGSTHVIFDVVGFYADATGPLGSRFHAIDPYRYFDTRNGAGGVGLGPLGPDGTLSFKATGIGGVPSGGVSAVVMNVTVTQPTQPSYLTVYPGDVSAPPNASNLNYLPGMTVPNLVTVRVPADGMIVFYNRFGTAHLLADVVGYYDDDRFTEAGRFVGLAPSRIFDSRVDFTEPFFEDSGTTLAIVGYSGVPLTGAGAAVLNVTATRTTAPGYVTVFPDDLCGIPLASNLNFGPGQTIPNLVMVRIASPGGCADPDYPGGIYLYNRFGYVHLIVDLFGYFTDASSYDEYVTITDDTQTISIDVPVEWNDIYRAPVGDPPEPSLIASPDINIFLDGWDVPAVWIRVSRTAAMTYPTPAEYLASFGLEDLADECATTDSGPYDDGTYVGKFGSAEQCGAGSKAGYLAVVAQAAGTDYYVTFQFNTITQRDADAVDGIIASLEVDPSF